MCRVRTRSKREASSQNMTRKTSHMLNIPYNFLNGFELISKLTCGTSQSAEIRRSAEKSHVWKHAYPHTHTQRHTLLLQMYQFCTCLVGKMALESIKEQGASIRQLSWVLVMDGHKREMIVRIPASTFIHPERNCMTGCYFREIVWQAATLEKLYDRLLL